MEIKGQRTKNDRKRRKLEWMFYREKQIMRAVKEARADTGSGHTGGNGAHALVSDPTAIQGIKAASELKMVVLDDGIVVEKPERWLRVIHNTYKLSDGITKMILIKRFRESKTMSVIADEVGISERRAYDIKDDVFNGFIETAAAQEGLLRVY